MSAILMMEAAELRNDIKETVQSRKLGIAVEQNVLAIFDRKISFAYDCEDITDAYKIAMRNLNYNCGVIGHSFGAQ